MDKLFKSYSNKKNVLLFRLRQHVSLMPGTCNSGWTGVGSYHCTGAGGPQPADKSFTSACLRLVRIQSSNVGAHGGVARSPCGATGHAITRSISNLPLKLSAGV